MRLRNPTEMVLGIVILLVSVVAFSAVSACSKPIRGSAQVGPVRSSGSTAAATPSSSGAPNSGISMSNQPTASTLPASVWIDTAALPLNDSQHWPDLADVARPLTDDAFSIQSLCQVTPAAGQLNGTENARARADRGANGWSLQQQIVHYVGDPWTMGQTAWALFNSLVDTATNCATTAPDARVAATTPLSHCQNIVGGCSQAAFAIEIPQKQISAHIYLSAPGSSVTELSVWSSPIVNPPWSAPPDTDIFAAMNPQICAVWQC